MNSPGTNIDQGAPSTLLKDSRIYFEGFFTNARLWWNTIDKSWMVDKGPLDSNGLAFGDFKYAWEEYASRIPWRGRCRRGRKRSRMKS